jgi:PleD family two-component response regulator
LICTLVLQQHKKVHEERKRSSELEIKVADRTAELRYKKEELEQAYVQLKAISLSDPLTALSNRRYLQKLMPMDIVKVQREYENKFSNRIQKKPSLDLTFLF